MILHCVLCAREHQPRARGVRCWCGQSTWSFHAECSTHDTHPTTTVQENQS